MTGGARPWRIEPGVLTAGSVPLPGDKSITHRAILFGLLAEGESRVRSGNPGEDCASSRAAARALGAELAGSDADFRVRGTGGRLRAPAGPIDCGNSGTSLRLLAGVVAGAPIRVTLTGDASLRGRPVDRVIRPLRAMGARMSARDGDRFPPLESEGGALRGVCFDEPTASAQVATAILLAGLAAAGRTEVKVRPGVRDHTTHLLRLFGAAPGAEPGADGTTTLAVEGPRTLRAADVVVPGDASAAAFFLVLAAITPGLDLEIRGVNLNPTRLGLIAVLARMGVTIGVAGRGEAAGEPVGDLRVTGPGALEATAIEPGEVPALVDEVPAWSIAAACARGVSRLAGAEELRVKESDRLRALAANLAAVGITARESPGGLEIAGGRPAGGEVRSGGDHRIAMAFAILGTRASGPIRVDDAASVATSFPGFASTLASLGGRIAPEPGSAP